MAQTPKRSYAIAIVSYLLIPAVVIAGAGLSRLIDPEWARGHADYARNFRLLELVQGSVLMATAGLALVLWASTCYLVLRSRQRSPGWLLLAAGGPFGFMFIAMLADRSPAPGDLYQQFIRKLKMPWRVALEGAVLVCVWILAFEAMLLRHALMIRYESFTTGRPAAGIIAERDASSGMWAFAEGLETAYLVTLIYLLWPIVFNLAGHRFKPRTNAVPR